MPSIEQLLEASRRELLDLSTRNRLLSMPVESKSAKVIHVRDEKSDQVFRLLVGERKVWEPERKIGTCQSLPFERRTLQYTYPELQAELVRYFASIYAPKFDSGTVSAENVRAAIAKRLPDNSGPISTILGNDFMLVSLLESVGFEATVKWGVAMMLLATR